MVDDYRHNYDCDWSIVVKELIERLRDIPGASFKQQEICEEAADALELLTAELEKERTGHDSMAIYNDNLIAENRELQDSFAVSLLRVKQLEAECVALRVDAERYRWLRVGNDTLAAMTWCEVIEEWTGWSDPVHLDAEIDAAIKGNFHD